MNSNQSNPAAQSVTRHQTMSKTWVIATRRKNRAAQQKTNNTVEILYHSILKNAKKQLSGGQQPVFERDYRKDRTESGLAMHCFMTSSFYFFLECDVFYNYRVQYAFGNCPFEHEVRAMLKNYPFDNRSGEVQLKPDFNSFYHSVLHFQDSKYLSTHLLNNHT